jgi:Ca2+-dependent lipid-binding protein
MNEEVDIKLWDWDQAKGDDFLGECKLTMAQLKEISQSKESADEGGRRWIKLVGVKTGKVHNMIKTFLIRVLRN